VSIFRREGKIITGEINMPDYLPYKKFLFACLFVWALTLASIKRVPKIEITLNDVDLPNDYLTVEGYVVSKRFGMIWLADEPISIGNRLFAYITSNYGVGSVQVLKHDDARNLNLFSELKINQKVRIYGDYLMESNPPRISAYWIEHLTNDK